MNEIATFQFPATGATVRTVLLDGEPWFVARDVCVVLDITNGRDAVSRLDPDGVGTTDVIDSMGRTQSASTVNESGLYELIFQSRKPEAKAFRRWVTHEVLPSIRRTGRYSSPPPTPALPDITTPSGVLAMAEQFARTARQLVDADERIRELEPKALAHDALQVAQSGDLLVREAAKVLGWQEKLFRRFLVDEHLLYQRQATCGRWQWDFYAANRDHFNAVIVPVEHTFGSCAHYTIYVTPRGMDLIHKRIAKRQNEMHLAIGGTL